MIKKRIRKSFFGIFIGRNAYKVACLGVTEGDWRALAMEALEVRFIVGVQSKGIMLGKFGRGELCGKLTEKRGGIGNTQTIFCFLNTSICNLAKAKTGGKHLGNYYRISEFVVYPVHLSL